MNNLKERIEKLEKIFIELNTKKSRLDGQYETIIDQLKELGCSNLEEAQKTIGVIQSNLEKERNDLLVKIEGLETRLGVKRD
ncbi:MAG: hypothetical protein ACFFDY_00095 [Candidatus Thorarchaeota archaeon]